MSVGVSHEASNGSATTEKKTSAGKASDDERSGLGNRGARNQADGAEVVEPFDAVVVWADLGSQRDLARHIRDDARDGHHFADVVRRIEDPRTTVDARDRVQSVTDVR